MGKIAKPQRSRKHKKIKAVDPFYTGDRLPDRNILNYNQAPRHGEEQEFSRSLQELVKLKDDAKSKIAKRKKKKKQFAGEFDDNLSATERGVSRPMKPTPEFRRRKGESEKAFLNRVHRETDAVLQMAKFEEKFDVDIEELRNDKKPSGKKAAKRSSDNENGVEISAAEKKKLRLKKRKEKLASKKQQKKEDRFGGFAALKDNVRFGEVAMQPPTLTAKPRKPASEGSTASKPNTKSLLLTKILSKSQDGHSSADGTKTNKRKLSLAEQSMLAEERSRVIQLYRDMKQQRERQHVTETDRNE